METFDAAFSNDDVRHQEDPLLRRRELGDVPGSDLNRRRRGERRLRVRVRSALVSALARLSHRGEDAVHRADRREVDPAPEQARVHLRRRLVGELGKVHRVEEALTLTIVETSRVRCTLADVL